MLTVWRAPASTARVRRLVEIVLRIVYVAGVPVFLLRLFLLPS